MISTSFSRSRVRGVARPSHARRLAIGALVLAWAALVGRALPASAQVNHTLHKDGWILAAARAPGLAGSIWRTDLWINATSVSSTTKITLYFCTSGQDNSSATAYEVTLTPGQEVYYLGDVVEQFLHVGSDPWVGAIHYVAEGTDVQTWARVYSVSADETASFGQLVEGIPTADMTPDDDPWDPHVQQWIYAMRHTADGRYRVNVGIVNPTAVASSYYVNMYGPDGNLPARTVSKTVDVPPYSMVQLSDPFAEVNGGDWSTYQIRVESSTEGAGAFAYASVVDNATNDAYFVRGVKKLEPPVCP